MAVKNARRIELTLPSSTEIAIARTFDAPRSRVFDAHTKPEILRHWLAATGWVLVECEIELAIGGAWRYVWHGPNAAVMEMRGIYREVVAPERLVSTQTFTDCDVAAKAKGEVLTTTVFRESGGSTTLALTMKYPTQDVRDEMASCGMQRGMEQGYGKLDEYLASTG